MRAKKGMTAASNVSGSDIGQPVHFDGFSRMQRKTFGAPQCAS
jgi:hypothetical protein